MCQGIWQLSHLRKYGGSRASFSFEAGSQAMGGEGIYQLETRFGNQIKELLDCVAQHKPLPRPESFFSRTSADRASTAQDFYVNVPAISRRSDSLSQRSSTLSTSVSSPAALDTCYENMPSPRDSGYLNITMNADPAFRATLSSAQRASVREASPISPYENSDVAGVYAYIDASPSQSYVNVLDKRRSTGRLSTTSSTLSTMSPTAEAQLNYVPVQAVAGSSKGRQRFPLQPKRSATTEYTEVDIEATRALSESVKQHDLMRETSLSQIKS